MDSSEHVAVGDSVELPGIDGTRVPASTLPLELSAADAGDGGRRLTYGQVVALGGDFYGDPAMPISSAPDPVEGFQRAWATLRDAPAEELGAVLEVLGREQQAVADAVSAGALPSSAFTALGDSLSYEWNRITYSGALPFVGGQAGLLATPGRYMQLAYVNMDHFGADAVTAYRAGHTVALRLAAALHDTVDRAAPRPEDEVALRTAYAVNAFADHFLTDLFAAGHLRTPRRALHDMTLSVRQESGLLAKVMHDEDNSRGLVVTNRHGDTWTAYGDGLERDPQCAGNLSMAMAAAQASAEEVYAAFHTGVAEVDQPRALDLAPLPLVDPAHAPEPGGPNGAPLFWADAQGYVSRRGGLAGHWDDPTSFDYTYYGWTTAGMVTDVLARRLLGAGGEAVPAPH